MPGIKSAKKRAEINKERREANRTKRSALRTAVKKVFTSQTANGARTELVAAAKRLDQAAAAGLIHKNKAAHMKSRLAKKVNTLQG